MKYLCLAYGNEKDWNELPKAEQKELLAHDEILRERGALMAAVETNVMTVSAWNGTPKVTEGAYTQGRISLAGFSVIEADEVNEVIRLVAQTPCARANGAIEVRPISSINDAGRKQTVTADESPNETDEDQIRIVIGKRIKAVHDKDIDSLLSHHMPNIVSYDVVNPLQSNGVDNVRERAERWFSSYQSSIGYEIRDLSIATGETVAFCHYLYGVSGTLQNEEKVEMWVRATVCLQNVSFRNI